jgi:phospho-N-acetylmuramoyl-pentapeptide-transferase
MRTKPKRPADWWRVWFQEGTPTMGGILIVGVMDVTALLWAQWNTLVKLTLISVLVLAGLGFYDDYAKITQQTNKGAKADLKLWVQGALALFITVYLWLDPHTEKLISEVMVPFVKHPVAAGMTGAIIGFVLASMTMWAARTR